MLKIHFSTIIPFETSIPFQQMIQRFDDLSEIWYESSYEINFTKKGLQGFLILREISQLLKSWKDLPKFHPWR
jgi:hypothetical protein